jgi:hypothetical protein
MDGIILRTADEEVVSTLVLTSLILSLTGIPAGTTNCRSHRWEARGSDSDPPGIRVSRDPKAEGEKSALSTNT